MFTQTFIPQKTIHTSNNYAKNTSTKATVTDFNTHTHKKKVVTGRRITWLNDSHGTLS